MGSKTGFLSRIGNDPFSNSLRDLLKESQVNYQASPQTLGKTAVCITDGDETQFYNEGTASINFSPNDINENHIKSAKVIFASGITLASSESNKTAIHKAFKIAKENNVLTAFDPSYKKTLWQNEGKALDAINELIPMIDVLLPSAPEDTIDMIGFSDPQEIVDYYLMKGIRVVACKAGLDGCYLGFQKSIQHIPGLRVNTIDTMDASNVFNGGFLHGLSEDKTLQECARLANTTVGLYCMNSGTINALPTRDAVYSRVFSSVTT